MDANWFKFIKNKYELTDQELYEYVLAFEEINNGSSITPQSLMIFLNQVYNVNNKWTLKECEFVINVINNKVNSIDNSALLTIQTFIMYMIPFCNDIMLNPVNIRQLFDIFDQDKNGFISVKQFMNQLVKLSHVINPIDVQNYKKKLQRFINSIDVNHDNKISYDEFKEFIIQNNFL
jgi:Ca2+-binding EF-hand superfamily protein